jgi:hypothetical protein
MKPKHTPGPWVISGDEIHDKRMKRDEHGAWIGDRPNRIATIDYMPTSEGTADANIALIAAAPDLLGALERLVFLHGCEQEGLESGKPSATDWMNAVHAAESVIQRAKGEEQ